MPHDPTLAAARILIADDQQLIVRVLERVLRGDGYCDVCATTNPHEAVTLARALQPDLILLDLNMAPIDGLQVMAELQEALPEMPTVLVLTGASSQEAASRARTAGAWDVLTKPFERQNLLDRVEEALTQGILQEGRSTLPDMPSVRLSA